MFLRHASMMGLERLVRNLNIWNLGSSTATTLASHNLQALGNTVYMPQRKNNPTAQHTIL
jgi:hypothetical protein